MVFEKIKRKYKKKIERKSERKIKKIDLKLINYLYILFQIHLICFNFFM